MNIFVNGCFDILHRGHIELFQFARSLGRTLTVAIDTDERVKENKGSTRPINCLEDRKFILNSIECIDKVVSFSSDEELCQHLENLRTDILVVGSDWRGKRVVGEEKVKKVMFFDRIGEYSTTNILLKGEK